MWSTAISDDACQRTDVREDSENFDSRRPVMGLFVWHLSSDIWKVEASVGNARDGCAKIPVVARLVAPSLDRPVPGQDGYSAMLWWLESNRCGRARERIRRPGRDTDSALFVSPWGGEQMGNAAVQLATTADHVLPNARAAIRSHLASLPVASQV